MKLYPLSFTEIEDDFPSHVEIPDLFFPFAQADITECSTYVVVCRLKASPTYTITSKGGSFSHPDYPGVTVTIPENAVAPNTEFSLELKVGLTFTTHFVFFFFLRKRTNRFLFNEHLWISCRIVIDLQKETTNKKFLKVN